MAISESLATVGNQVNPSLRLGCSIYFDLFALFKSSTILLQSGSQVCINMGT